ncbi:MAG TPA: filamentous hemagglutinin N-terminal domain-containing protein, partial [Gammaproteobacteria bacterium]|nr:filamentous hemagglutinin N-terminal domain-containing protein [Gammaproteobacteria bacterium]
MKKTHLMTVAKDVQSLSNIKKWLQSCEWRPRLIVLGTSFLLMCSTLSFANPTGGQVTAGQAAIAGEGTSSVNINQSSGKAIINWQTFNINANESTHFQQPAGGVALNHINGNNGVSQIYGHLSASGQIILLNAAGIYFGPSAMVNVGGIIASTARLHNDDFMHGNYNFTHVGSGSITNDGTIIAASHGLVALVGSNVTNNGLIQANLGHVVLATGDAYTVSMAGNDMINFAVTANAKHGGKITNNGTIRANGGSVLMTANAAAAMLDDTIDMNGVVEAKSVGTHHGQIILNGNGGTVYVSGKLIASGRHHHQTGGTVEVLGNQVALTGNALVDVSGNDGGGTILIGGNAHGAGPQQDATQTYIGPDVNLYADAITNGNGGTVVVWSNYYTQFYGSIFARGGAQGGNGGWIETSGSALNVGANSMVNASAPYGQAGSWLLDPTNIYIASSLANANAAGMSGSDESANTGTGTNPEVFAASGAVTDSLVLTSTIDTALNTTGTDVEITTENALGT